MSRLNLFTLPAPVSPLFSAKNEPRETGPSFGPHVHLRSSALAADSAAGAMRRPAAMRRLAFHSVPLTEPEPAKWAAHSCRFQPDPVQTEILNHPAHRLILLCTRQFGKTQITALKALHFALTHPGALVVVASPTERRSAEWLLRITHLLQTLGLRHRRDGIHQFSAVLPNQSRLIGLPGVADTNRGYPAHLLIFEEAAYVPDPLWKALTPSLVATRGRLWLISSAGPQSGFFHEQWSETASPVNWTRFRITATQCPRISPESLAEQRLLLGESDFNREFQCEFSAAGSQVISQEFLNQAFDPQVPSFNNGRPIWWENK